MAAQLNYPLGVAVDGTGDVLIADANNNRVRKVDPSGVITTYAGSSTVGGFGGDGGPATGGKLNAPEGVAVSGSGEVLIADFVNQRVRKVDAAGTITSVAGDGMRGFAGDGGPAALSQLNLPRDVALDSAGDLFIADVGNTRVREVATSGLITTVGGNGFDQYSGDGGPAANAQLYQPVDVATNHGGNVYILDWADQAVRRDDPSGVITTVVGTGVSGFSGDGGPATSAQLNYPTGLAADDSGALYISDTSNNRVRKVDPSGTIITLAGQSFAGDSGDGGPAAAAILAQPAGLALDSSGNLYVADAGNNRVRRIDPTGTITTVAGNGSAGFSGDGGVATSSQLNGPQGVALNGAGDVIIADTRNNRLRMVDHTSGLISTVAGTGVRGFSGDGGVATSAQLAAPLRVAVDGSGSILATDQNRVRRVDGAEIITTVAGNDQPGFSGDGGAAGSGQLADPSGMAFNAAGDLLVADQANQRIRSIEAVGSPSRPTTGDYDGDGRTDVAVFRPSTGAWFVQGGASVNFGTNGDIPVPGDYNGDGRTDVAVFRPSTGAWFVQGGASVNFGTNGDIPVVAPAPIQMAFL